MSSIFGKELFSGVVSVFESCALHVKTWHLLFFFIPGDKGEKIGVYSFSAEVRKEDLAELALVTARSMRTEEVL